MSAMLQMFARGGLTTRSWRDDKGGAYLDLDQGSDNICISGPPAAVRAVLVAALAAHDAEWPQEPARCPHCGVSLQSDGYCPHGPIAAAEACAASRDVCAACHGTGYVTGISDYGSSYSGICGACGGKGRIPPARVTA